MSLIRRDIADSVLRPGELYSGYQLSERFGVSRSPVRDALLRLAEEGAVRLVRNRGFYVNRPLPQDIVEIFAVRLALEVSAAGRTAGNHGGEVGPLLRRVLADMVEAADRGDLAQFARHDEAFHRHILDLDGNQRQVRMVERLREETNLLGASTFNVERTLREVAEEHEPIVLAMENADAAAARLAMREHLISTGLLLLRRLESETGESLTRVEPEGGGELLPPSWI